MEYKDYDFYGRKFSVSEDGRIFYTDGRKSGKEIKGHKNSDGYIQVCLNAPLDNGKRIYKRKKVHRIVASLFVENPNNLPEVNHIDFNIQNNNYKNLEWVNHFDNIMYSMSKNRNVVPDWKGSKNPKFKLSEESKQEILKLYDSGMSAREIFKTGNYNVTEIRIEQICKTSPRYVKKNYPTKKVFVICGEEKICFENIDECSKYVSSVAGTINAKANIKKNIQRAIKTGNKFLGMNFYR